MTVRLIIVDLKPERELCWTNQVLLPGILDSEHHFQIEPLGDHRTPFINREIHSGLLVTLLWRWYIDTKIRQKFEEMNRALKKRVEESFGSVWLQRYCD